jgi:hypothetical protein
MGLKSIVPKATVKYLGLHPHDLYVLKSIKRPEWVVRLGLRIPRARVTMAPIEHPTAADILLCERLITAYIQASEGDKVACGSIWARIIGRKYNFLHSALEQREAAALANVLSLMFRSSCVHGIASGDLYTGRTARRIWELKLLDDLVSLAEFLAVTRVENPEQGQIGAALSDGIDPLVDRIEEELGTPIGFPNVGGPYGLRSRDRLLTMESPEHIYVATRIRNTISFHLSTIDHPIVLEIGAGFGGTASYLLRLAPAIQSYVIVDLPIVNVLQGYFLSKTFGINAVSFFGEANSRIQVLPTTAIDGCSPDVLVNENSMPEMAEDTVHGYLRWAKSHVHGVFYSYQQEAWTKQVWVREAIKRVGGFRVLSRNPSWVRRGYVEEVYSVSPENPTSSIV